MKIKIKVPGKYLDDKLKAHDCVVGDVVDTRDWYAENIIKLGRATAEEMAKETVVRKRVTPTPGAKKYKPKAPVKGKPVTTTQNVFLDDGMRAPLTSPAPLNPYPSTSSGHMPKSEDLEGGKGEGKKGGDPK